MEREEWLGCADHSACFCLYRFFYSLYQTRLFCPDWPHGNFSCLVALECQYSHNTPSVSGCFTYLGLDLGKVYFLLGVRKKNVYEDFQSFW